MPEVQIRPAHKNDTDGITTVLAAGDTEHAAALPHVFNDQDTLSRAKDMLSRVEDRNTSVLVAELDSTVVGVIHLEIKTEQGGPGEQPRKWAWILTIDVEQQHRQQGIGQRLMEAGEQWATAKGATHLEFDVWDFNQTAIQFYQKLGYRPMSHMMSKALSE
jgi:diamine N-acetyltransferase